MDDLDKYENLTDSQKNQLRNDRIYRRRVGYYTKLPTPYLHNDDYKTRLTKAEALNGCKFKDAKPYSSKRWGEPMSHNYKDEIGRFRGLAGLGDGKIAVKEFGCGFRIVLLIVQVFLFVVSFVVMIEDGFLIGLAVLLGAVFGLYWLRQRLFYFDVFIFNRHTGLVRTPHKWWRRSFYIPHEDLDCYDGGVVKSARGGAAHFVAKVRVKKIPKRFYLVTPQYLLSYGGLSQLTWASYMAFMDHTKPIEQVLYESIESHYKKNQNATLSGKFPEELKQYIDPDDKQICKDEVW